MSITISGTTGVSLCATDSVPTAAIQAGAVTPAKTQVSATPSMVRLNTANGYGSTNTKVRRFTNVVTNQGSDITYADSATNGASFTINTSGVYAISHTDQFTTGGGHAGISINSNQLTTNVTTITASHIGAIGTHVSSGNETSSCAVTLYLTAGDVVRAHTNGETAGTLTNACQFTITRVA